MEMLNGACLQFHARQRYGTRSAEVLVETRKRSALILQCSYRVHRSRVARLEQLFGEMTKCLQRAWKMNRARKIMRIVKLRWGWKVSCRNTKIPILFQTLKKAFTISHNQSLMHVHIRFAGLCEYSTDSEGMAREENPVTAKPTIEHIIMDSPTSQRRTCDIATPNVFR